MGTVLEIHFKQVFDLNLSNIINNVFVIEQTWLHAAVCFRNTQGDLYTIQFSGQGRVREGASTAFCAVFPTRQFSDIFCTLPLVPEQRLG